MLYEYECNDCHWSFDAFNSFKDRNKQACPKCQGHNVTKLIGSLVPMGTRDGFGIKNSFEDKDSGQTIDNWRSWEKAGYRNPLDVIKNNDMKEKVKEQIEKRS
jgi:putative FmdB family regulatory protein